MRFNVLANNNKTQQKRYKTKKASAIADAFSKLKYISKN